MDMLLHENLQEITVPSRLKAAYSLEIGRYLLFILGCNSRFAAKVSLHSLGFKSYERREH